MKHGKLTWKLGIAAIVALGLSAMPAHFNVPGIGVEQAFAATLDGVTVNPGTHVYTGETFVLKGDNANVTAVATTSGTPVESGVKYTWTVQGGTEEIDSAKDVGTYKVKAEDDGGNAHSGTPTSTFKITPLTLEAKNISFENNLSANVDFSKLTDAGLATLLGKVYYTDSAVFGSVTPKKDITEWVDIALVDTSSGAGEKTIGVTVKTAQQDNVERAEDEVKVEVPNGIVIADAKVTVDPVKFTGEEITPNVTVTYDGDTLTRGEDYRMSINEKCIAAKEYTVTIENYKNSADKQEVKFNVDKATTIPTVTLSKTSEQYTGAKVEPTVKVKLGNVTLDDSYYNYTWTYDPDGTSPTERANVIKSGTYKLVLTSENIDGTATGGVSTTFKVTGADLSKATLSGFSSKVWYTGSDISFDNLVVTLNGKELAANSDYRVTYANNAHNNHSEAGQEYKLTIEPNEAGNGFEGKYETKYAIIKPDLKKYGTVTLKRAEAEYTGKDQTPEIKSVVIKGTGLEDMTFDKDSEIATMFTISKTVGNADGAGKNVGTSDWTVKGVDTGMFGTDGVSVSYKIVQADLSKATIALTGEQSYSGEPLKFDAANIEVTLDGFDDRIPADNYTVSYANNINAGEDTASITITGKKNFTGTATKTFTITPAVLTTAYLTVSDVEDQTYTGAEIKPANLTIKDKDTGKTYVEGTEYALTYANNTEVGTATITIKGTGNYYFGANNTGIEQTFKIVEAEIGKDATVSEIAAQPYTGSAVTPVKVVRTIDGKEFELKEGTDYTVEYKNNIERGTASYTVTGKGNYTKSVEGTFEIKNDFSAATVAAIKAVTYTGKALKPAVTVTLGDATLKEGTDYTVAYSNNTNAGKATVTITPAGSYAGDAKTASFTIKKASVKAKVTNITGKEAVGAGKTITLKATLNPAKSDANQTVNTKVTWTSNKTAIAKVNKSTGKVTGVSAGKAKITVKAADGSKKSKTITVYGITSKNLKQTVKAGKTKKVTANDTIKSVKSSNTKVATVTYKGKKVVIKGVKKGTAKVTVTTKNGGKNVITVTVK